MNKSVFLLICTFLTFALQSCSKTEPEHNKTEQSSQSTPSTTSLSPGPNAITSMDERFNKMTGPDGVLESEGPVLTAEQIKDKAEKSTVFISAGGSLGTGWFVAPGWVVTNHHVIKNGINGYAEVYGPAKGGLKCQISKVLADDPEHDLAIIELRYISLADMTTAARSTPHPFKSASTDDPITEAKKTLAKTNESLIQDSLTESKDVIAREKQAQTKSKLADDIPYLSLDNPNWKAKQGMTVYEFGNPVGYKGTFSSGIVSGFRDRKELQTKFHVDDKTGKLAIDAAPDGDVIQYTTPSSHGSSGSALLNDKGRVIGVCFAGDDNGHDLNFAVPVRFVRELLDKTKASQ